MARFPHICLTLTCFALCSWLSGTRAAAPTVDVFGLPSIYEPSKLFALQVNGIGVPVHNYNPSYDYAHFSLGPGNSTIEISALTTDSINSFNISPQKLGLIFSASTSGNKLTFSVHQDHYLIVKINSLPEIVIAADPLEKDIPPSHGKNVFNVSGADDTGQNLNLTTQVIQRALDDASNSGSPQQRGIVYIPKGLYLVGNLILKSNTEIYLEGGAVLLFSGFSSDYITYAHKDSQNRDLTWWISTEFNSSNILLHGRGTLDGNGKFSTAPAHNFACNILVPISTSNFAVDGILTRDSGTWGVIPVRSKGLRFSNMKFLNRFDMGEDDGIDINESQDVYVNNALGIALDDPFSTKAWPAKQGITINWPGDPQPVRNVLVENALSWTFCWGYKIGQGLYEDQTNVTFRNSVVYDAAIGIGSDHKYGQGKVQDAVFENIVIERLSYTLEEMRTWMTFLIRNATENETGPLLDLMIRNITLYDAGHTPASLHGHNNETGYIRNVTLDYIYMPAKSTPATSLAEMNVTDVLFSDDIEVLPVE